MAAQAPGAFAEAPIGGTAPAALPATVPAPAEVPLPSAERLRASLLGLGLATAAIITATVLALLIVAGTFHTSLGSIG